MFYKVFANNSDFSFFEIEGYSVKEMLGFGDSDIIEPAQIQSIGGTYKYKIKQLPIMDAMAVNGILLNCSEEHFAYSDFEEIKRSIRYYNSLPPEKRRWDLGFLLS